MVSAYVLSHKKLLVYVTVILTCGYIMFYCRGGERSELERSSERPECPGSSQTWRALQPYVYTEYKKILLWTSYYGSENWDFDALGSAPFKHELCSMQCHASRDRRYLPYADAIIFNYADADFNDWPQNLTRKQVTILIVEDPPTEVGVLLYKFEGRITYVMSYRRDSDIYAPYRVMTPVNQPMPEYSPRVSFQNRTRSVVWISSECETPSRRELYVKELSKHIDVDIYGKCGTLTCPEDKCMDIFEASYKFYLAFENSMCKGFISDNFFLTLKWDIVPIVLGGGDYQQEISTHGNGYPAIIDAKSFVNPKALARFLKKLSQDEQRYNEYFRDKLRYKIVDTNGPLSGGFCKLCHWLYGKKSTDLFNYRSDLAVWWHVDTCSNTYIQDQMKLWPLF